MKTQNDSVRDVLVRNQLHCGIENRLLDVSSELGEVSKEVLKSSGYGKKAPVLTDDLAEEIGDLIFAVHALASERNLDPLERLTAALNKYEARRAEQGDVGSDRNE
jgi:NTP pyrophosphatase (non-canonical NTP hydrolase)